MKRTILLSLAVMLVLASTLSFAPAPTVDAAKPQDLSLGIHLIQFQPTNVQHGDSDRYRTTEEHFVGWVTASNWEKIPVGSRVSMDNFTNYEFVPGPYPGTFDIEGTTHSTIEIANGTGSIVINGNGKIKGTIPFRATVEENLNSNGGTGSLAENHVNGKLSASFTWLPVPGTTPPNPDFYPRGDATITGQYQ